MNVLTVRTRMYHPGPIVVGSSRIVLQLGQDKYAPRTSNTQKHLRETRRCHSHPLTGFPLFFLSNIRRTTGTILVCSYLILAMLPVNPHVWVRSVNGNQSQYLVHIIVRPYSVYRIVSKCSSERETTGARDVFWIILDNMSEYTRIHDFIKCQVVIQRFFICMIRDPYVVGEYCGYYVRDVHTASSPGTFNSANKSHDHRICRTPRPC